jgi:polysaccharide pyruvyl transferase WcaK-like protein
MSQRIKKICVLGNYSGRNAGDAAILGGLFHEITSKDENVEFIVPTLKPKFIHETYKDYNVTPIDVMPWRMSVKLLGVPTWRAVKRSDLVLVTDAILFDRGLYNPVHNYLSTMAFLVPMARKKRIPVALYNSSLGPVPSNAGKWCLKRVLDNSDLVILRDEESKRLSIIDDSIRSKIVDGADSALSADPCSEKRVQEILKEYGVTNSGKPRIGININSYGDAFVKRDGSTFSRDRFLTVMADIAEWLHKDLGVDLWLFGTQYMDFDILSELRNRIKLDINIPVFTNRSLSFREIMGLLKELDLLIGMRTHSTILSSSMSTPVVGIITYPKTFGYLERIGQAERTLNLHDLDFESLKALVTKTWQNRDAIREGMISAVEDQRKLALGAAEHVLNLIPQ